MSVHRTDEGLIERLRRGDPEGIAALYYQHARSIHALAVRITGSTADADDVLHDLFVGLPMALRTFEGRGNLEGWLRRVAVRLCLMLLRRKKIRGEVPLDVHTPSGARAADLLLDRLAVQRALEALPDHLRAVIVLKEVEGYSHEEIAGLLDITPENSMVRLHRGRKMLKQLLGGER